METNHIQNILHDLLVKVHYYSRKKDAKTNPS